MYTFDKWTHPPRSTGGGPLCSYRFADKNVPLLQSKISLVPLRLPCSLNSSARIRLARTNWSTPPSPGKTDRPIKKRKKKRKKKIKETYVQGGTLSRREGLGPREFCEQGEASEECNDFYVGHEKVTSACRIFFFHGCSTLLHFRGQTILFLRSAKLNSPR